MHPGQFLSSCHSGEGPHRSGSKGGIEGLVDWRGSFDKGGFLLSLLAGGVNSCRQVYVATWAAKQGQGIAWYPLSLPKIICMISHHTLIFLGTAKRSLTRISASPINVQSDVLKHSKYIPHAVSTYVSLRVKTVDLKSVFYTFLHVNYFISFPS